MEPCLIINVSGGAGRTVKSNRSSVFMKAGGMKRLQCEIGTSKTTVYAAVRLTDAGRIANTTKARH
jgi:hypothetical protein